MVKSTAFGTYDDSDENSILRHGRKLIGKNLRDLAEGGLSVKAPKGKTGIGDVIEAFFGIKKNNESEPDFPLCGVELKTLPLNKSTKPKYPLSISMIDYEVIKKESWPSASVRKKLKRLLVVFYADDEDHMAKVIKHVFLWSPSPEDLMIFKHDWRSIRDKVNNDKADELSETDTFYLVARRKGSKGEMRTVSAGDKTISAKSRCFALKRSFVESMLIKERVRQKEEGSLIKNLGVSDPSALIRSMISHSRKFWGRKISDIDKSLNFNIDPKGKSYAAQVVYHALGLRKGEKYSEELSKAGISVKTLRCNPGLRPIYAMSLRGYKYSEIVDETWDDSILKEDVSRMLIILLVLPKKGAKQSEGVLESIFYFEPSGYDLKQMKKDWSKIVDMIRDGNAHMLTGHIGTIIQTRPKAQTSADKIIAPGGHKLVKKGFFIRTEYLKKMINENYENAHPYH